MSWCRCSEPDSINGRKCRPLLPKPNIDTSATTTLVATPCSCCLHGAKLTVSFSDHQQLLPPARSRWSPTAEQLEALEEMYKGGTRTPSPEQIKQIASRLRRFGHVEGRNVFYWFQNHKARERHHQKRPRRGVSSPLQTTRRESGMSRKCFGSAHGKDKATSNCSAISEETTKSMCRALVSEGGAEATTTTDNQKQLIMKPFAENKEEDEEWPQRTLELFPVRSFSSGDRHSVQDDGYSHPVLMEDNCSFIPSHFFEFLPLKKC